MANGLSSQDQPEHGREASGVSLLPLGEKRPEAPVLVLSCQPQHHPICQPPAPTGGPRDSHQEWGLKPGDGITGGLAFPKPTSPGCLQTESGSDKAVQESLLGEPGRHRGEAAHPGTPGQPHQHVSYGPREATQQPSGTEPEDTEGSRHGLELLEHQLLGDLCQEGPPLKGDHDKERRGGKDFDEDRDVDESSPQDSPPSQVSPGPQSSPTRGGPPPDTVSRGAPGFPGFSAEGAIRLPVDFLSNVSTEIEASEPPGPGAGPTVEGQATPPEFTFHVEIKANVQKEQGHSEVDLEGAALPGPPGEEREPQGPSEGEDTKKTDLPEPSEKQPTAVLPEKPVSRVPQLKGLCLELLRSFPVTSCATQAAGTATELPTPSLAPAAPEVLGLATKPPTWALPLTLLQPPPPLGSGTCSSHAWPPLCMSPTPRPVLSTLFISPATRVIHNSPSAHGWLVGGPPSTERVTAGPLLRAYHGP